MTEPDNTQKASEIPATEQQASEIPATEQPAKEEAAAEKHTRKHRAKRGGGLCLLLVIIFAAAIGGLGYYAQKIYKQQTAQLASLASQQAQLQEQNSQLKSQVSESITTLTKQQAELTELTSAMEDLRARNQFLRKDWLVMEAEYLLQLANYRVLFERDVNTAVVALTAADTRLHESGDPSLIAVRQAIAEAVQALKAVPHIDLAGISVKLSALIQSVDELPLNTPEPKGKVNTPNPEAMKTTHVKSWSEFPAAIWADLKSLIVIRNHREPVEPLIPPDQQFFLMENLRLQLEQARLALLSSNTDVYKERLATVSHWIETYFNKESSKTQAALATVNELSGIDIAPTMPDISKPYQLLEQYRQNAATTPEKK